MKDKKWRPNNWGNEDPCEGCPDKVEDEYGLFCALSCGLHARYVYEEAGADAMLEALFKLAQESPTGKFEIDSHVVNIFSKE